MPLVIIAVIPDKNATAKRSNKDMFSFFALTFFISVFIFA